MSKQRIFSAVKRLGDFVVTHGKGSRVWTKEGGKYLDFTSGIAVLSTGHCHPTVVAAVQEQAARVTHIQVGCAHNEKMLELADKVATLVPGDGVLDSFFFANSGAEAVEGALRLARQATGKDNIIAFTNGYHGRTQATLAVTSSSISFRGNRIGPSGGGTFFAPFPTYFPYHTSEVVLQEMEHMMKTATNPQDTAAVLIEPVLGEGGYIPAPPEFMKGLRSFCDNHGILLIADEVQSGFGRTGKMFAVEHSEVVPDILVMAKGIASGYPLSAIATRKELSDRQTKGSMGGTYGGNAVACAAALATIQVFEQEKLLDNVMARGAQLTTSLLALQQRFPWVCDVRGPGLMVGLEFDQKAVPAGCAAAISKICLENNLMLLPTGVKETLRFAPALVVSEAEVAECLDIFGSAMEKYAAETGLLDLSKSHDTCDTTIEVQIPKLAKA